MKPTSDFEPSKPVKQPEYVPPYMEPPRSGGSWVPGCLIGCSITFILIAILITAGIYFAFTRGPNLIADAARTNINQAIDQIVELPAAEKRVIKQQVDRVVDAFKTGDIKLEELSSVLERIAKSPLIGSVILIAIKSQFLDDSGLSDDEKKLAGDTVQRVWHGISNEIIDPKALEDAFKFIATKKRNQDDDGWELKENVSDEELRQFFLELNNVADDKEIPDVDYEVSIGEEVKKIVDDLLDKSDQTERPTG